MSARRSPVPRKERVSSVLIVEDDEAVAQALEVLLELHDIPCQSVGTPAEALEAVAEGAVGVVLQDMNFRPGATSGDEGAALFRALRKADPELPVLLMTAWASLEAAVALVREGATDYFGKPWDDAKLVSSLRNLLRLRALEAESARRRIERSSSRAELVARYDLRGLVYESDAMHRVVSLAVKIAAADVPVLVTGPSGSGKERLAEIVQANSRRSAGPFVKVNVGALPHELIESELFGAEAGAYTGASRTRPGRFEAAHGGTLFLDEIGTLPPEGQVKLLRVLQIGEFERLGSNQTRRVDVRVIGATNTDLPQADPRRPVPRGPLLPAERRGASRPRPQGQARRRAAAGERLPRIALLGRRPCRARPLPGGAARAPLACVARQRARAREPRPARPPRESGAILDPASLGFGEAALPCPAQGRAGTSAKATKAEKAPTGQRSRPSS